MSEVEGMIPFERDVYISMINEKIKEQNDKNRGNLELDSIWYKQS